jgi:hypothetical protein
VSLWGHLEQRFGTERPRKLLTLDDEAMAGPVHLIACHRRATESQSLKHLGFPALKKSKRIQISQTQSNKHYLSK